LSYRYWSSQSLGSRKWLVRIVLPYPSRKCTLFRGVVTENRLSSNFSANAKPYSIPFGLNPFTRNLVVVDNWLLFNSRKILEDVPKIFNIVSQQLPPQTMLAVPFPFPSMPFSIYVWRAKRVPSPPVLPDGELLEVFLKQTEESRTFRDGQSGRMFTWLN
jgi:hypothetical protein